MSAEPPVRVLVADTSALFGRALLAALEDEADLEVVGRIEDDQLDVLAGTDEADVLLVDGDLLATAPERCAQLSAAGKKVVVVADPPSREGLHTAIACGADGYVPKAATRAELGDAVRRVAAGEIVLPPRLAADVLRDVVARNRDRDRGRDFLGLLTRREREVLELLTDGCNHGDMAEILSISPQTARAHIQHVLTKLGVHSRVEAAALAVRYQLFDRQHHRGAT